MIPSRTTSLVRAISASAVRALALAITYMAAEGVALAQAPSESPPAQTIPPIVIRLDPVRLDAERALAITGRTDTSLEVFVVIERDGRARLDDEAAPAELREPITTALGASQFQPAQSNGQAVPARVKVRLQLLAALPAAGTSAPAPENPKPVQLTATPPR